MIEQHGNGVGCVPRPHADGVSRYPRSATRGSSGWPVRPVGRREHQHPDELAELNDRRLRPRHHLNPHSRKAVQKPRPSTLRAMCIRRRCARSTSAIRLRRSTDVAHDLGVEVGVASQVEVLRSQREQRESVGHQRGLRHWLHDRMVCQSAASGFRQHYLRVKVATWPCLVFFISYVGECAWA